MTSTDLNSLAASAPVPPEPLLIHRNDDAEPATHA